MKFQKLLIVLIMLIAIQSYSQITLYKQDTLHKTQSSITYNLAGTYYRAELYWKSDTAVYGADTIRIERIGAEGDTSIVYGLDSSNTRVDYFLNAGDNKYKNIRIDAFLSERIRIVFKNLNIYTNKIPYVLKLTKTTNY